MGEPWTVKRYIDEVFTEGHGKLYASDGRTRSDSEKNTVLAACFRAKIYAFSDLERSAGSLYRS